ncbi:MAG: family 10 glycosylhydrolase [Clostridia bacterium]|nr:family 10 glycosylhydrolase [Clostridia bacterium]
MKHFSKRTLSLLLAVAMVLALLPAMAVSTASAATVSSYSAAKRIMADKGFDKQNAYRGADQLILFTSDFAPDSSHSDWWYFQNYYVAGTTCTNQWGTEVVINEWGYVTAKYVNPTTPTTIPSGGYVLSGNGTAATFLQNNVEVGDMVKVAYPAWYIFRVTDDDKLASPPTNSTGYTNTWGLKYTKIKGGSYDSGVTVGGSGVTTGSTVWQTDVLVKITDTGTDSTKAGKGYVVGVGGSNISVPSGYAAITVAGQPLKDDGTSPYNGAQFVTDYAPIGSIINFGANEIFIRHDAAAAVRAANLLTGTAYDPSDGFPVVASDAGIVSAQDIYDDATGNYKLVDTSSMSTALSEMQSNASGLTSSTANLQNRLATIYRDYKYIYKLSAEKKPVEYRAVWIRPFNAPDADGKTKAQLDTIVENSVLEAKNAGYNMIFLETFYNSTAIMPVNYTYNGLQFKQNPYLTTTGNSNLSTNYDTLQKYIDVCHQYGMELHVWMEVFYVGYQRTNGATDALFSYSVANTILDNQSTYANYLNVASNGDKYYSASTANQYFLNPQNSGVRNLLLGTYRYIWNNYDIDGFQLDYIRYPETNSSKCFGYDSATISAFKAAYPAYSGYSDSQLKAQSFFTNADWVQFRADQVTSFVNQVKTQMATDRPDIYLTAATGYDYSQAKNYLMQDLAEWFEQGYIDILFPMAYGVNVVKHASTTILSDPNNTSKFACSGVSGSYESDDLEFDWLMQTRESGIDGLGAFGLLDGYASTFTDASGHSVAGPFSVSAITPTGNAAKAAIVYLKEVLWNRLDKVYSAGYITSSRRTTARSRINTAVEAIRTKGLENATSEISNIRSYVNSSTYVTQAAARTALRNDVDYVTKMRTNSHDRYKAKHYLGSSSGFTVNGTDVVNTSSNFKYNCATDTLYITSNNAVLSGTLSRPVNVVFASGVTSIEMNGVTLTGGSDILGDLVTVPAALDAAAAMTVELTGTSNITTSATFCDQTITYLGTGKMKNGSSWVMVKGDVNSNNAVNSSDIRAMMAHIVHTSTLSAVNTSRGDVDGDGKVTSYDARIFFAITLG